MADGFCDIVSFFSVGVWSASESTIGIMIVCLPAAYRLFKRGHQQSPLPQAPGNPYGNCPPSGGGFGTASATQACCEREHHCTARATTPGCQGRTRRRHSMSVDTRIAGKLLDDSIISPRSFVTSPTADDSDAIELASPTRARMFPDSSECTCGRPGLRPGEYLGVSERYILTNQDVSVTISDPSGEGTTVLSPDKARYYI